MVIAIDGLSATGKSTLAFKIANELGLKYLNSGSIYRCITLKIMQGEIDYNNDDTLEDAIDNLNIDFKIEDGKQKVFLDKKDVTFEIKTEEVSRNTPLYAGKPILKKAIRKIQKKFVDEGNVVIEGRDIATRIAPNADYKFYFYASLDVRADRLYKAFKDTQKVRRDSIYEDLKLRDEKDLEDGNTIIPDNAIKIDTTNKNIEEVFELMLSYIKNI